MSSLRCLFIVQGEGRGHLTQALALRALLAEAGHTVAGVVVGQSPERTVPPFFEAAMEAPIHRVPSPHFVADAARRGVRAGATLWQGLRHLPRLPARLDAVAACLERTRPDVVVNFFEPLAGLYYGLRRPAAPMVSIAHQYMFLHPAYRFPPGWPVRRQAARWFARLTAWGSARRIALSLYPVPDRPGRGLAVLPPLLRPRVQELAPAVAEPAYLLVYLLNRGYLADVIQWHARHPTVPIRCFVDRPGAPPTEAYDDTLTLHALDGAAFLSMMARCRGLVSTAGFESVAEAMYLGKPVQVVPVDGHFEQHCNAFDVERAGAGCWTPRFDLGRIQRLARRARAPDASFRRWVAAHRARFVRVIEEAVAAADASPVPPVSVSALAAADQ